ncbi:MAG: hypothetical protein GY835_13295 [bacterium]|nr:hypothetical protein [bacterium]
MQRRITLLICLLMGATVLFTDQAAAQPDTDAVHSWGEVKSLYQRNGDMDTILMTVRAARKADPDNHIWLLPEMAQLLDAETSTDRWTYQGLKFFFWGPDYLEIRLYSAGHDLCFSINYGAYPDYETIYIDLCN